MLKSEAQKQSALSLAILQDTSHLAALHAEARSAEEAEQKAEILKWLSNQDQFKEHHDNISRYKEGTGMWFLNDPKFVEWRDGVTDTLFCVGMPGAGKTVMSAMVIRHLFEESQIPNRLTAVAFLYLRYDLQDTQSFELFLRSLISQVVNQLEEVPGFILEAYSKRFGPKYDPKDPKSETKSLKTLLQAAVKCFSCVYFVLDALDECDVVGTQDLILTIRSLQNTRIKLFTTSRFKPEVEERFESKQSIEIRGSDADIESYARGRVKELPRCVKASPTLQEEVIQAIVASARGMFLLSKLHVDSLRDKRTLKAVKNIVRTLPSGSHAYETAYDWAIKRITEQSKDDYKLAQEVLTWIVYALRPLTETDLETALAVELGEKRLDPDNFVTTAELVSLCAGLVTVDEESKTVRLAHYTTREYFARNPQHLLQNPHRILSDICISYLGIDDFMAEGYVDDEYERHLSSHAHGFAFLSYAAKHWENHSRAALPFNNEEDDTQTSILELQLLQHKELMESYFRARGAWTRKYQATWSWGPDGHVFIYERKTGMQYAAARGNPDHVSALLKLGLDPDESMDGTTALFEAARGHHQSIVRLLIEAKADISFQAEMSGHTALTAAIDIHFVWLNPVYSASSHKNHHPSQVDPAPTVALLLEAGADPEHLPRCLDNLTPLMRASEYGLETVVTMLCKAGVDVDRRGGHDLWGTGGRTALHIAACHGHKIIVKQLLQHGCDPTIVDNKGKSPAVCAAEHQQWATVEVLLEASTIDTYRTTPYGDTLLELALRSESCPEALIEWLLHLSDGATALMLASRAANSELVISLESGTTVLFENYSAGSPLAIAAWNGRVGIVRILLDTGGVQQDDLSFIVILAASRGHVEVLRILINAGADINIATGDGTTALMSAVRNERLDAARMLIEAGAAVNARAVDGSFPFMLSATLGNGDITRLLLDSGANAQMRNVREETVLMSMMRAAMRHLWDALLQKRIKGVFHMVVEAGVDINASSDNGDTALWLTTEPGDGHPHLARVWLALLLQAGADISISERSQQTALISFSRIDKMDISVLESLLEAGADPNERDDSGMTALMWASSGWNGSQVNKLKVLLAHGSNPNAVNKGGETALMMAIGDGRGTICTETVCELLTAGANPNHEDDTGRNVFFYLALRDPCPHTVKYEMVFRTLVDAGGNISAVARNHETLLMWSARIGAWKLLKLLLAAGTDPHGSNKDGQNAIMLANIMGGDKCEEVIELLLDAGVDPNQRDCNGENALMLASRSSHSPVLLRKLLSAGMDPHERDANGRSMLMLVALNNRSSLLEDDEHENLHEMVAALIAAGVCVDLRDKNGNTALMYAVAYRGPVRILLRAGANPNITNNLGETALMKCFIGIKARPKMTICALIDAGANLNITDNNGRNVLIWAASSKHWLHQNIQAIKRILKLPGLVLDHADHDGDTAVVWAERVGNKLIADLIRKKIYGCE